MVDHLREAAGEHRAFIESRVGRQATGLSKEKSRIRESFGARLKRQTAAKLARMLHRAVLGAVVFALGGKKYRDAFREGIFRQSGEIHRVMYDSYSLTTLMEKAGFVEIQVCAAYESRIPDFNRYELDVCDGSVRKPDSLFLEGLKPLG